MLDFGCRELSYERALPPSIAPLSPASRAETKDGAKGIESTLQSGFWSNMRVAATDSGCKYNFCTMHWFVHTSGLCFVV